METIYEWLLHNMGNEGNCLTVLNVQRHTNEVNGRLLDVMARTKDFAVINVLVQPAEMGQQPGSEQAELKGRSITNTYFFADEASVIAYFSEGKVPESAAQSGIRVLVLEPASDVGEIIFPPK